MGGWFRCGYGDDEFTGLVMAENEDKAIERYKKYIKERLNSKTIWDQTNMELFWVVPVDPKKMAVIV